MASNVRNSVPQKMIIDADPFHSSQFANTLVQLLLRELFLFWCKQDQPQPTHRGILFFHGCRRSISLADIVILVVFFFLFFSYYSPKRYYRHFTVCNEHRQIHTCCKEHNRLCRDYARLIMYKKYNVFYCLDFSVSSAFSCAVSSKSYGCNVECQCSYIQTNALRSYL